MDESKNTLSKLGDIILGALAQVLEVDQNEVGYTIYVILKSKIGKQLVRDFLTNNELANADEANVVYEVLRNLVDSMNN